MSKRRVVALLLIVSVMLCSAALVVAQQGETVSVTSFRAPIHTEPDARSETVVTLSRGTLLSFVGFDDSKMWVEVTGEEGVAGWVSLSHVHLNGPYIPPEDGITRTLVDGFAEDWERFYSPFIDEAGDSLGTVDIRAVRTFMNDTYAYFLIEVDGSTSDIDLLLMDIVTNDSGVYGTYQYALPRSDDGAVFVIEEVGGSARDASIADVARRTAVEFRLPLSLLDSPAAFNIVSLAVVQGEEVVDDLVDVMPAIVTLETEAEPDGAIVEYRVNLRAAPRDGQIVDVLPPDTPFALVGRTDDAQWLQVRLENGRPGWLFAEYVGTAVDIDALPVTG